MPVWLDKLVTPFLVTVLTVGICGMAVADDSGWASSTSGVYAGTQGNQAQVQAGTQGVSGGQAQPSGDHAAPGGEGSGHDPWAKYTLVTNPTTGGQQLCLTVNAGQAGLDSNAVQVCYAAIMPEAADGPVALNPAALAAQAVARLSVPAPQISISPHPSGNKWNVLAVGLPIWVWADDPGPITSQVSEQGIDIQLQAIRGSVTFDWGDATTSVCNLMRPRPAGMDPLTPSPDCGHTYLSRGDYTITATAGWAVNWQALGQSGALPLNSASTVSVPIREFSSLVVG